MSGKKKLIVVVLCLAIMISVGLGLVWHVKHYVIVDFEMYPRDLQTLDLRGQNIGVSYYNKLCRSLPDCQILWDIPIKGKSYPQNITTLAMPDLAAEDVQMLAYFPELKTLDARGCVDYVLLQTVRQTYPELEVLYTVTIGGVDYDQDAKLLKVKDISGEELKLLDYLPELNNVRLEGGSDPQQLKALIEVCRQRNLPVQLIMDGEEFDIEATSLSLEGLTEEQIPLLYLFSQLKQLTLTEPVADGQSVRQLRQDLPGVEVTWTKTLYGVRLDEEMEELDLTYHLSEEGAAIFEVAKTAPVQGNRDEIPYMVSVKVVGDLPDRTADTATLIQEVEQALSYFPNIKKVILGGIALDNEAMAAFREAHRQDYKVVWTVQCGNKIITRTDTTYFMPTKFHVYYFLDSDSPNLKYCEDIVALDLGHMAIKDTEFVKYMPNLEYLILAHTQILYVEPLSTCKNLKFLEVDESPIRDFTPLKGCTSLEDLNIGNTYASSEPIQEMTWLKNLWMVGCSEGARYRVPQALPDTRIMTSGNATVAGGWRELPNYYAMRDELGMFYMVW